MSPKRTAAARAAALAALLGLALSGCAGYRLGTTLPPDIKTIHVPTFVNACGEPLVENETTRATREEFQKDGTLRITADASGADLVLKATLTDYTLEPLRYERDRPRSAREYRLKLTAEIAADRVRTGGVLVKRRVEGDTTFELTGDLASAKAAALPRAAADLAHKIVGSVVECW
jgi:hypothetical protein